MLLYNSATTHRKYVPVLLLLFYSSLTSLWYTPFPIKTNLHNKNVKLPLSIGIGMIEEYSICYHIWWHFPLFFCCSQQTVETKRFRIHHEEVLRFCEGRIRKTRTTTRGNYLFSITCFCYCSNNGPFREEMSLFTYSETCLKQTPWGPIFLSVLDRCLL